MLAWMESNYSPARAFRLESAKSVPWCCCRDRTPKALDDDRSPLIQQISIFYPSTVTILESWQIWSMEWIKLAMTFTCGWHPSRLVKIISFIWHSNSRQRSPWSEYGWVIGSLYNMLEISTGDVLWRGKEGFSEMLVASRYFSLSRHSFVFDLPA